MPVRKRVVLMVQSKMACRSDEYPDEGTQQQVEQAEGQRHQGAHPIGADHAQQQQAHDDEEAPGFYSGHHLGLAHGQQSDQDAPAIEWRQRKQVEYEHHHVDQDATLAHAQEKRFGDAAGMQHHHDQAPQKGLDQVDARPCQRDPDHVAFRIAQVAEAHGHRFGVTEHKGAGGGEKQHQGHYDGAHRVDVLERVQCDAPQCGGRVVAEMARRITVRGLMDRDRKQYRKRVDQDRLDQVRSFHRGIVSDAARSAAVTGPAPPGRHVPGAPALARRRTGRPPWWPGARRRRHRRHRRSGVRSGRECRGHR